METVNISYDVIEMDNISYEAVNISYDPSTLTKVVVGVVVPIYVLLIVLPSIFLNVLIVVTFCYIKDLRTPSNLLSVHISIIGILTTMLYSSVAAPTFATQMLQCNCRSVYYKWLFAHVFHFSMYPLNILVLSASYFFILKFSAKIITFKRVFIILAIIWFISIAVNIPNVFIVPFKKFKACCEGVCLNQTYICDVPLNTSFAPNEFTTESAHYFRARYSLVVVIPTVFVFIFSSATYIVFWKSIINATIELRRRMLLLPILMTVASASLFLVQNTLNWYYFPPPTTDLPGIFYDGLSVLSSDIMLIVFAVLILYFNVRLRSGCLTLLCCRKEEQTQENQTTNNSLEII